LKSQINADKANMKHGHIALPFSAGLRYDLGRRLTLGSEVTFRVPFTDYLDGVSQAGNVKSNDWYYTANLLLGYKFGQTATKSKSKKLAISDRDGDGLADNIDNCPDEAGEKANRGCPAIKKEIVKEEIEEPQPTEIVKEKVVGSQTAGERVKGTQTMGEKVVGSQTTGERIKGTQTTGEKAKSSQTTGEKQKGTQTIGEKVVGSQTTGERSKGTQTTGERTTTTSNNNVVAAAPNQVVSRNSFVDYSSVRI
jgi:hypothetical protein